MKNKIVIYAAALLSAAWCASNAGAQTNVGQWDFDNGTLNQTSGADLGPLTYIDGPSGTTSNLTAFGTTPQLGISNINGTIASVMRFPGNSSIPVGYYLPTPPGNGGGSLVNDYSVIFDVYYPANNEFRPLLQMDDGSLDHILALLAINAKNQIAVTNTQGASLPSSAFGQITANTWYRIGFTVSMDTGEIDVYTNGQPVGVLEIGGGQTDGPYALYSGDLPVFSSNETNSLGYANSVQIRDAVLNPGEMEALGGPSASGIPITLPPAHSYIYSRSPGFGQIDVGPEPAITVDLNQGDSTITAGSIKLALDGQTLAAQVVAGTSNDFLVSFQDTVVLTPLTTHTVTLSYSDSISGARVKSWQFRVANYQVVNLPQPIYFENFDEVNSPNDTSITPVSQITFQGYPLEPNAPATPYPSGWSVSNYTVVQDDFYDLTDANSDYYLNWALEDTNYVASLDDQGGLTYSPGLGYAIGNNGRLQAPPIVLNGVLISNIFTGNMVYCDSDHRQNAGGQVNVLFTSDYNLTGYTNVYLSFYSCYEQNQDNLGSVEYSIDQGATWLPALYMLDDGSTSGDGSDVVTNSATGQIDVFATFGTPRDDQAFNLAYSNFIGAVVSTNLAPFVSPRRNDDPVQGKRIEVLRVAQADNQPHVRFRFGQAGTSSWFFGIDNFGLYTITLPVISVQPASQEVDANTPVTFLVVASGANLTYQWQFNGVNISGATSSSYNIASAQPTNAGLYTVVVTDASGPTTSNPAQLTVDTFPNITLQPSGEIVDLNGNVTLQGGATGGQPLTYTWYRNGAQVINSAFAPLPIANVQYADAGSYTLVAANSYGASTSSIAVVKVWAGPVTSNLVVHLPFDGDLNDTSGRGNNATYLFNGPNSSLTPRFVPGFIGSSAFEYTTTSDYLTQEYASLGYPSDLLFGASTDFSISFWCRWTNQNDDLPFISNKDWESSSDVGWGIFTQTGGNYRINATGPNLGQDKFSETDTPQAMEDGNWHNVVVSFQRAPFGSSAFIYGYLDGRLVSKHPMGVVGSIDTLALNFAADQSPAADPNVPETSQNSFAVNVGEDGTGCYADDGSAHDINAAMDDLGIWRRALTANEAKGIFTAGLMGFDLTKAPTATLNISRSGANVVLMWLGNPNVELEESASLTSPVWTPVSGSLGASTATIPAAGTTAFFRLVVVP